MGGRAMIVSLAVAASMGVAACGGEDGLAKSELASKADGICTRAEADVRAVKAPTDPTDLQAAGAYFDKVVPIAQKQTDDLADLQPADDVEDDWNVVVDKQKQGTVLLKSIRDKAKAKDSSGRADLEELRTTAQAFSAAAKKIGADSCAGD